MKILIAEDESLARATLRSMLHELELPIQLSGEAKNGEEMIEMVMKLKPDLVFVDIRLPRIDGLEAIKMVQHASPFTHWVILSGFSEFRYAQEAVRLGALNYLLKPVSPEDLKACLLEIMSLHKRKMEALNSEFGHTLMSILHGNQSLEEENLPPFSGLHMRGTLLMIDSFLPQKVKAKEQSALISTLLETMKKVHVNRELRSSLVTLRSGRIAVVCAWHNEMDESSRHEVESFEQVMLQAASVYESRHLLVSLLQTSSCHSVTELLEQMAILEKLAPLRIFLTTNTILSYSDLQQVHLEQPRLLEAGSMMVKLADEYQDTDYLNYSKELLVFEKDFSDFFTGERRDFSNIVHYLHHALHLPAEPYTSFEKLMQILKKHGEAMFKEREGEEKLQVDTVQIVIDYIDRHYMDDIGIGLIADEIGVTPNYLSSLFHKKCGMTFMKYLTQTRMLKAKELLLSDPTLQVQKVAGKVGYYSTRHFTKLFTDYFGYYPSEIRAGQIKG